MTFLKTSGHRLRLGAVTAPRSLAADGLERAWQMAEAPGDMTGKPVQAAESRRRQPRVVRPHYLPAGQAGLLTRR